MVRCCHCGGSRLNSEIDQLDPSPPAPGQRKTSLLELGMAGKGAKRGCWACGICEDHRTGGVNRGKSGRRGCFNPSVRFLKSHGWTGVFGQIPDGNSCKVLHLTCHADAITADWSV